MKMEINYFKISLLFLRILLLLQLLFKNVLAVELGKEEMGVIELNKDLNSRMTSMEAKSDKQEVQIQVLSTLLEEEKKFTKKLSDRITQLESSTSENSMKNDHQLLERPKRTFRFMSPNISANKQKNKISTDDEIVVAGFNGPPTNCKELGKLGNKLNGYYLVQNEDLQNSGGNKMAVVLCRFQLPPGKESILEERVGFISIINSQPSKIPLLPSSEITLTTKTIPAALMPPSEKQFTTAKDQFNWKSEETPAGQYVYADGCDFLHYDLKGWDPYPERISKEMCREHCLTNTQCTHTTWVMMIVSKPNTTDVNDGLCFLKQAPIPPNPLSPRARNIPRGYPGSTCGYFSTKRIILKT